MHDLPIIHRIHRCYAVLVFDHIIDQALLIYEGDHRIESFIFCGTIIVD